MTSCFSANQTYPNEKIKLISQLSNVYLKIDLLATVLKR